MKSFIVRLLVALLVVAGVAGVALMPNHISYAQGIAGNLFLPLVGTDTNDQASQVDAAEAEAAHFGGSDNEPTFAGRTYGEWSAEWWKWVDHEANRQPKHDVLAESGSTNCASGQEGPVWFLAGTNGSGAVDRTCRQPVPAGKTLFYPIMNLSYNNVPPDDVLTVAEKRQVLDGVLSGEPGNAFNATPCGLRSTVDGVSITLLKTAIARTQSPPFYFRGDPQTISDGFWVMLQLPKGKHVLTLKGSLCSLDDGHPVVFAVDVTYHLTVR